jgi:threonine/homoserine/homoserine lactone efflux protein
MDMKLLFGIWSLHFVALISPGPDFMLTLKNTLKFGKVGGILGAFGFGVGILTHCLLSISGVYLFLTQFYLAKAILNYFGAIYLIWIGLRHLFLFFKINSKPEDKVIDDCKEPKKINSFLEAFFTNLFNPKAGIFILSLFSGLAPRNLDLENQIIISLGIIFLTIIWFSLVALFFDQEKIRMKYYQLEPIINFLFSFVFILFGLGLLIN